ncbi:MAG: DUF6702 family protein [Planctomycetaceae bacterium]
MIRRRLFIAASALLFLLADHPCSAEFAHPFHATSLELEWNPETGCFEAALRLPGPPLDEELARIAERPVSLDTTDPVKRRQNEKILEDWVRNRLKLTAKDLPNCEIRWVGAETELRSVWAYFEIRLQPKKPEQQQSKAQANKSDSPAPKKDDKKKISCPVDDLQVQCRFFEHLRGQVNATTIRIPGRRGSVILTEVHQSGLIEWAPAQ